MSRPRLAPLAAAFVLLVACSDDAAHGATEAGATTTGSTTADAPTTGAPTTEAPTTTTATPEPTTTTGDAVVEVEYARGLRLTRATVNQGVQVEVVHDGVEVAAGELGARLLRGRKAVMRADWLLHADFVPREITGRLTLWTPEGETRVDEFTTMVAGPSNDGDLFTTFTWQLPANLVGPGLQYRIEALEPDLALAAGEVSDPPPILPLAGPGTLVVQDQPMELSVVLVPIQHEIDGMSCTPTVTDADVAAMGRALEQHNPVERAAMSLGAPMVYTASIGLANDGFVSILTVLAERRAQDKPGDNVYYYGLIESCDSYPPGLGGQAFGIPDGPSKGNAYQRLSVGRYSGSGAAAAETFVHEVGHSQGLYHVRCSGGEAGADPDYPHPNGRIGVWGYGIHDTAMRSPTSSRDYMSYCGQSWVSDFGWEKTFDSVAELTSWDSQGPAAPPDPEVGPIVVGVLSPAGGARWFTTVGAVPRLGRSADTFIDFAVAGATVRAPAARRPVPDSDAISVVAALPSAPILSLSFETAGKIVAQAPAAQVTQLHDR